MTVLRIGFIGLITTVTACGPTVRDTTTLDVGPQLGDGGVADRGTSDSGVVDGGFVDGGFERDAGSRDAGLGDDGPSTPTCSPVAPRRVIQLRQASPVGIVPVTGGYLMPFTDRPGGNLTEFVMKLDEGGAPITQPETIGLSDQTNYPDVIADGDGAAFVYSNGLSLQLVHIDSSGLPSSTSITLGPHSKATIAKSDDGFGVAYSVRSPDTGRLWYLRLDASGRPSAEPVPLTDGTTFDVLPDLAWNGTRFGLAFSRDLNEPGRVHFFQLDKDGVPTSTTSSLPDDFEANSPVIASNGDGFLMMTAHYPTGYARLFDAAGTPTQSLYPAGDHNTAAWAGDRYVMVWTNWQAPIEVWTVVPGSAPIQLVRDLTLQSAPSGKPKVAWDGLGYAIVWGQRDVSGARPWIYFARVCP